ncbi:Predicted arabinose efflux permease, MFS family [Streptomyces sp. DvalAA-14]|uniref:MFS transporter n=1 Tax=unclassified Streptomyces TaxID=2593676 RepID=UPI00081BC606|nr:MULTISPECIES: MFS transporter [unclassified Streptomyces]SCD51238.1 Predicted arabinose efflux permease, MFS family [Streptomyces sp. DvalAA-14]
MFSRLRLGPLASLSLLASIVVSLLAASSAPTPLYAVYQREWGFSPITTTVVFGVYALAVLAALLVFGRISDHIGRRPVLFAALAGQIVAMVVFAEAGSVNALLVARVLQGVSTGAALGAIGAGLLDIDRVRGAVANSFAPMTGTATGALVSGLVVQFLPSPTHLVYYLLLAVFALQTLGVVLLRESVRRKPGALASMKPDIRLPRAARRPVAIAVPVLFAIWALAGFYGALAPGLTGSLVHSHAVVYGGLGLFVLAAAGALSVLLLRGTSTRTAMVLGVVTLIAGVAITLVSIGSGTGGAASVTGFFVGTALAGFGFGGGFQGGIRLVVPVVEAHERAGVLSLLYVVSYLGMGVPAVIGGVLVVHGGGLLDTAREYGAAVIVLAAAALAGLLLTGRRTEPSGSGLVVAVSAMGAGKDMAATGGTAATGAVEAAGAERQPVGER